MRIASFWILIVLGLYSCDSSKTQQNQAAEEQPDESTLTDSEIPKSVQKTISRLEENGVKVQAVRDSKWNVFGAQGIWLKTEKGIVDIVSLATHIDATKIEVTEVDSDTVGFYAYELRYEGSLEQRLEGRQLYFIVGEDLIYKTADKELNDAIRRVEFE